MLAVAFNGMVGLPSTLFFTSSEDESEVRLWPHSISIGLSVD